MTKPAVKKPLWRPSKERMAASNMTAFMKFLERSNRGIFNDYSQLFNWSIENSSEFWEAVWQFTEVIHSKKYTSILQGDNIRTARWFTGARLNFAENLLRLRSAKEALVYWSENQEVERITFAELYEKVASLAQALKEAGVQPGDRVAAFISNRPEAIIGMLATAAIGATWSSCSPDFGFKGVLDRFGQIKPKILIATNGYRYNGKIFDSRQTIRELAESIPEIEKVIVVNSVPGHSLDSSDKFINWQEFLIEQPDELSFAQVPFDHPLYILFSSGTTGKPKCIVHGAGGTLLQHLKELILHTDLKMNDKITYFTTCGWMMWNWMVSSLAVGAPVFLYDGSPSAPDLDILFRAIEEEKITIFGTSPKFLSACENQGLQPKDRFDLSSLRTILSTGSPLAHANFKYVYREIKPDVQLASISGGTDIISCFMLGNPLLPVYSGELQCRGLGMDVQTFNVKKEAVTNQVGELVCVSPFPSRPIYFWDDENGDKYKQAYFDFHGENWYHGDYVKINDDGSCIVYGRSDATLNPGGVRIGTAEIYEPVEAMDEIFDSIVIGRQFAGDTEIVLFVVLKNRGELTKELQLKIKNTIRSERTPRHVPAEIYAVDDIPHTRSGKKVEMAITRLLHNQKITNYDALANPQSLKHFEKYKLPETYEKL
ncbi:MAG: acetoacetate--CoA ligase [Calditrichaeota bacterium]|nr:MAG: acetoacetate--CoA ligase [Calditrichota bacterium]